jgi:probable F420-dependent oxidoreductase
MRHGVTMFLTDQTIGVVELARAAEDRGFDSLFLPEHTHIPASRESPWPGGGELPEFYWRCLDPFVALMAAAAATERLRVGTGILLAAQHEPLAAAKAVATLDMLSGGRVTLGVGFGWNVEEMNHHGVAYGDRREVVREHVLAMRTLWDEGQGEFHGAHVDFSPSRSWPKPTQRDAGGRPAVPVLIGGGAGPKMFAHVVEYADGWMPIGGAGLGRAVPELRQAWEKAGRDPAALQIVPFGSFPTPGKLEHFTELGVTEVVCAVLGTTRDEVLPQLDAIADTVAPLRAG